MTVAPPTPAATGVGLLVRPPVPSSPFAPNPQQSTPPPAITAHVWTPPAATATAPATPLTGTGVALAPLTPLPSWPLSPEPQQTTPPSASSAHGWPVPEVTATAEVTPVTATGVALSPVAPLPSSPSRPRPQHSTVPPARTAHVCPAPALTLTAALIPLTGCAVRLSALLPFPSSPEAPSPQQSTPPPASSAQLWSEPAVTATAPLTPGTATGMSLGARPGAKRVASPQQLTPPRTTAQVCCSPAAIAVAPITPVTVTGAGLAVLVPSPSWPLTPSPQHATAPRGDSSAHVWVAPALTADGVSAARAVAGSARSTASKAIGARGTCIAQRVSPNATAVDNRSGQRSRELATGGNDGLSQGSVAADPAQMEAAFAHRLPRGEARCRSSHSLQPHRSPAAPLRVGAAASPDVPCSWRSRSWPSPPPAAARGRRRGPRSRPR